MEAEAVTHFPSTHKALDSVPSTVIVSNARILRLCVFSCVLIITTVDY